MFVLYMNSEICKMLQPPPPPAPNATLNFFGDTESMSPPTPPLMM